MVDFSTREGIMKEWDKWREYIAAGGKGSWPRDAFESLLDSFQQANPPMTCTLCGKIGPDWVCDACIEKAP